MKILVRAPNWIGDQIQAYPFYHELRARYPRAQITVVCVGWVESIQFRKQVNHIHVLPRVDGLSKLQKFQALESEAKRLRAMGPWDLGISLPNSFSAAWLIYRAGCKVRRGYSFEGRGILLNERRSWKRAEHWARAKAYLELSAAPGSTAMALEDFFPKLPENDLDEPLPGRVNQFDAYAEWNPAEVLDTPSEPYWVLAPGSQAESRRWPLEYFTVLARKLAHSTGLRGVVVGGPAEAPLAARLCSDPSSRLSDRCAQVPLPGLWKLFRNARFSVTNDSGLAHVSSLMGCSTFVVWGAGDPRHTKPHGPGRVDLLMNPVECWPCERNTCFQPPEAQLQCLKGIRPDSVYEEIRRVVRGSVPFRD
jgi:heptosyltransferase-2